MKQNDKIIIITSLLISLFSGIGLIYEVKVEKDDFGNKLAIIDSIKNTVKHKQVRPSAILETKFLLNS